MTQSDIGQPFTRAYVSSVESGRCVPSLSALLLIADRLHTTGGAILDAVNPRLSHGYNSRDANADAHHDLYIGPATRDERGGSPH
jgi:transcriptional regulator with XRE-family HTH domain